MFALNDTIAAIATPPGAGAARAIVRISGPNALDCLRACFKPSDSWPKGRSLLPRVLPGELTGPLRLPCDAYVWPSRRSYTRQPAAELHTLGSPPLVEGALRTVCTHGARLAQPGEFTLRAFLAGRLDLTQAEAVLGVIDSQDRQTLAVALEQLAGGLAGPLGKLRGDLLDLLADLEAGLDFVEEHIEFVAIEEVVRRLTAAKSELESLAVKLHARSLATEATRVAIVGWPNAGKSSLFNALAGYERSIVSTIAGTTRDYLQATVKLGGLECVLVDTAGFEDAAQPGSIPAEAQRMAEVQTQQADLRLWCIDATRPLNPWEQERLQHDSAALLVLTKCDHPKTVSLNRPAVETSAATSAGLAELRWEIAARLNGRPVGHAVASTAARCRSSIEQAIGSLGIARRIAEQRAGDELVAAEIRLALDELGKVTGAVYTEDLLDRIFSRFCIGK
ncbi:MAG: tRNA modification GTPase [Pirellulales bacterium]